MNLTSKILTAVTGTVVATAIGLGAMASASAPMTVTPPSTPAATVQQKCDREPTITVRYDKVHARIAARITQLQARHDKAVAAGHTKVAHRLERVITRVQKFDGKITARYDKYEAWFAANCATS
jgi:hypothetical protein